MNDPCRSTAKPAREDRERTVLTTAEAVAAGYLPSATTAKEWRADSRGPAFCRIGRLVRYRVVDLEEWVARQRVLTWDVLPVSQRTRRPR